MKKLILIIGIIALVACGAICYMNMNKSDEYIYKITYLDEYEPGGKYTFYIDSNYDVDAIEEKYCTTLDCLESGNTSTTTNYKVKISEKNKDIFKMALAKEFSKGQKEMEISSLRVDDNFEQIIRVLKYNDEEFFNYYDQSAK